jgi:citrate lyase beta subunit
MNDHTATTLDDLRRRTRAEQSNVARRTELLRADLPFAYLRQQAHLTAPASDFALASKALGGAHHVAARLLQRYGIEPAELARRVDVDVALVHGLLGSGGAPVVVLDLEDGVAPTMVAAARENVIRLLRDVDRGSILCFVRPAGIEDPRCADDLVELLIGAGAGLAADAYPLDGIVVPKIRHVHEVEWVDGVLTAVERALRLEQNRIRVSYQVETGWGVLNLPEIALAGRARLAGIILGTVDLSADLLLPQVRYRHPVCEWARTVIVAVAGAMGVPAIDGMTLDFPVGSTDNTPQANHDLVLDRMMANCDDALHSIDMGMSGRWTGHPLQLVATELAFAKAFSPAALEPQLRDLEAFIDATDADRGAIASSGGQLLDIGTDRHARAVLRRAVAWGYVPEKRARKLGLISAAERLPADR